MDHRKTNNINFVQTWQTSREPLSSNIWAWHERKQSERKSERITARLDVNIKQHKHRTDGLASDDEVMKSSFSRWILQEGWRRAPRTWSVWRWPSGPGSGSLDPRTGGTGRGCRRPWRWAPPSAERSPPLRRGWRRRGWRARTRSPDAAAATGASDSLRRWRGSCEQHPTLN